MNMQLSCRTHPRKIENRTVLLLSSEHTQADVDQHTGKPDIILAYNGAKKGVDHLDQMCAAYNTKKHTTRWPKCVFQHMIDVSSYNAFILWLQATGKANANRRQFLKMLGCALCGGELDASGNIMAKKKT